MCNVSAQTFIYIIACVLTFANVVDSTGGGIALQISEDGLNESKYINIYRIKMIPILYLVLREAPIYTISLCPVLYLSHII